ncbi:restriction endonuclease PLD domain-containing protein [Paraclostridium sordellii]|uniref:restriction endonuclease PLD domain-containing protein n=1 Tax=Paraclostridium sordellii TaxID=1505 RepID=UPI0005E6E0C1|nr:restriction endonuclease PLD domain-containing protein [Paeniclostridium sordellii]CEO21021.1 NgoFVII restriction endonuclease [[Clostridium] sordellii] [Paeniclostridium sordellii]
MFFDIQKVEQQKYYCELLKSIGALSKLFSDNEAPYIGYREAENMFCLAFDAENLSRSDVSADATKDSIGIGIKTFLNSNGKSLQKVAEFNKDADLYRGRDSKEIVNIVAQLRNERINSTMRIYGLHKMIYHCVVRSERRIMVFEENMDEINIKSIKIIKLSKNTITFKDDKHEYSFNMSKSTLYKRFTTPDDVLVDLDIDLLENPFEAIRKLVQDEKDELKFAPIMKSKEHVFLPLYSVKKGTKYVPDKSGLNQWNAGGRKRDVNEVYIPIPAWIHRKFEGFFPDRDIVFDLILPDKNKLNAKVCQDGGKALMSNPNLDLGKWILRQVMNLDEGELLTYEKLEDLGLDSVVIYKENNSTYSINFTRVGAFEQFKEENNK